MSLEEMLQPIGTVFYPMSHAMVGSVIPGVLRRYPVRIVNYPNLESAVVTRDKPVDPVKRFPEKPPDMNMEHGKGHPIMGLLKHLMGSKGKGPHPLMKKFMGPDQGEMAPGYERIKEDLSWRGRTEPQIRTV